MHVSILYYEDGPSHELALEQLHEVMVEEGVSSGVEVVKVAS